MTLPGRAGARFEIPDHCFTETAERVGVVDTDLMGIVHHAKFVAYFERGRLEYMRRRGLSYKQMVDRGLHMPVVELQVRYRRPAHFDDLLCVKTRLGGLSRVTVRFDYSISRIEPTADAANPVLDAHVLLACVDGRNRPRALPEDLVAVLLAAEATPPPLTLGSRAGRADSA